MIPTQPHIMPGTQNDRASLLPQSAQLTSTPNGQQMLPPPCAQSGMAQSPQRSRITVHRDPQLPSVPALQASPRPGVLQDISNIPPAVRLSVSDQQSSEMNKFPPATPLQDHATPVDQHPTQGHVVDQAPIQNVIPRVAHPAIVFHGQRVDIDPALTQAAINPPPPQVPTATPGPPSLPTAIPIEQGIHHFEQLLA
jgi:hypothetical protein